MVIKKNGKSGCACRPREKKGGEKGFEERGQNVFSGTF